VFGRRAGRMDSGKILVIDDEENMTWFFKQVFSSKYDINGTTDVTKGLSILDSEQFNLVMLDLKMPEIDGLQALKMIKRSHPDLPVVMMTAYATIQTAVEAMKLGAVDYIIKPFDTKELRNLIQGILNKRQYIDRNRTTIEDPEDFKSKIITNSPEMVKKLEMIKKAANTDVSVLIEGESGTGKELVACALHENSPRKPEPFISINCAAIPENLMESELFGYEKGAFTGAGGKKEGYFELAQRGTLFLDEIGDLPMPLQAKLLRVLEEKKITRLGGTKKIPVDVRIISASNKNLWEEVKKGGFREDLYFRLAVFFITLPPLRNRSEDIELLAKYFLNFFSMKYNKKFAEIDSLTMNYLLEYPWPGNVRELRNLIERIVIMEDDELLCPRYLPASIVNNRKVSRTGGVGLSNKSITVGGDAQDSSRPLKEKVARLQDKIEREMIIQALKKYNGNRTWAAQDLQISRRCLQIKIKNLNINEI
jgi:DNA-binding NtrC family response regulator